MNTTGLYDKLIPLLVRSGIALWEPTMASPSNYSPTVLFVQLLQELHKFWIEGSMVEVMADHWSEQIIYVIAKTASYEYDPNATGPDAEIKSPEHTRSMMEQRFATLRERSREFSASIDPHMCKVYKYAATWADGFPDGPEVTIKGDKLMKDTTNAFKRKFIESHAEMIRICTRFKDMFTIAANNLSRSIKMFFEQTKTTSSILEMCIIEIVFPVCTTIISQMEACIDAAKRLYSTWNESENITITSIQRICTLNNEAMNVLKRTLTDGVTLSDADRKKMETAVHNIALHFEGTCIYMNDFNRDNRRSMVLVGGVDTVEKQIRNMGFAL